MRYQRSRGVIRGKRNGFTTYGVVAAIAVLILADGIMVLKNKTSPKNKFDASFTDNSAGPTCREIPTRLVLDPRPPAIWLQKSVYAAATDGGAVRKVKNITRSP